MGIELRLKEQLLTSTIRIDKKSQYYGTANVVPVVALRMIYELISMDGVCLTFNSHIRKGLELLANNIIVNNKDICKLRGPKVYFYNAQSNLPILTSAHLGPTVDSNSKIFNNGKTTQSFNESDFTKNFSQTASLVKIITKPAYGILTYNNVEVYAGQIIKLSDIKNLIYTRTENVLYEDPFYFKTSNNETEKTFSNMATFTVNVDGKTNSAPTVDNNSTTDSYGETLIFIRAHFTENYYDEDGDAVDNLRITSLPTSGEIQYNGTAISVNDVFNFTNDIDTGKLTYVPDNAITDAQALDFTFQVSDTEGNYSS